MNRIEEFLEKVKKLCEQAETYHVSSQSTEITFEFNNLKSIQTRYNKLIALRLVKNGRIGLSVTNKPDDLDTLLNMALDTSQFGAKAEFMLPGLTDYSPVHVYDPETSSISIEKMVSDGAGLISKVRAYNNDAICSAETYKSSVFIEIMNTNGGHVRYDRSNYSLGIEGLVTHGTDMLFVGDSESSCHPVTGSTIAATAIQQLEYAKNIASPLNGNYPVIFTSQGVANALVLPIIVAFNGKTVLQGASPLGTKKGQQLFDKRFNVYDDATIDYIPGSRICDDEGTPSRRIALIEGGIVKNFLYDLQTAAMAGTESTGSAARSGGSLPSPSTSNLIISEGDTALSDMIADIKEGLVIEHLIGAGQGNVLGGEFGGNVLLGYKIENGKIAGRVKDTIISGNIYDILKEVVAIGSESRWVGTLKTSPVYCRELAVSTK
ncbi:MAG: TldD/PmbA family protein [Chloroflexi bacterium]|nr:TldD/PmbA family protein [Chloroflexota bacterium]